MAPQDTQIPPRGAGPVLFLRGHRKGGIELTALVIRPEGSEPGPLRTEHDSVEPTPIHHACAQVAYCYTFALPARSDAWYECAGDRYTVNADYAGDLRIAYAACNGQETGDLERPSAERNAMWHRLCERHTSTPLNLILHGGDQIYADEVTQAHPLSRHWPNELPDLSGEAEAVDKALRDAFFRRYLALYAQKDFAWLAARVPALTMWDDHDICDGWGSLPAAKLDSELGRLLFAAARDHFLLFQFGTAPDAVPEICADRSGANFSWALDLPGLHLVTPDLRSERRPDRVMGPRGWQIFRDALSRTGPGKVLLLSSVPVLGPRLSLVERLLALSTKVEKYEDDLRDQWQSRTHREEWKALLRDLIAVHERAETSLTVLSGEIHLATRGTMNTATGPLQQLVASGITHPPPPRGYARALGALAVFGEGPLTGHRIRLHPLPGRSGIYTAERNYLVLERTSDDWTAFWDLEESGQTPALAI